jgi:hypothetical protein
MLAHLVRHTARLCAALASITACAAHALVLDFDTAPPLPPGPSFFAEAGPMTAIAHQGVTISGGVVLGFPSNAPAFRYASHPNACMTANFVATPDWPEAPMLGLEAVLTLTLNTAMNVRQVEGLLFNGLVRPTSYLIHAYGDGDEMVLQQLLFDDVPSNQDSGFIVFRIATHAPIEQIDFLPLVWPVGDVPFEWNFGVDSIVFGASFESAYPIPEPGSGVLLGVGLLAVAASRLRVRRGLHGARSASVAGRAHRGNWPAASPGDHVRLGRTPR